MTVLLVVMIGEGCCGSKFAVH